MPDGVIHAALVNAALVSDAQLRLADCLTRTFSLGRGDFVLKQHDGKSKTFKACRLDFSCVIGRRLMASRSHGLVCQLGMWLSSTSPFGRE